MLFVNVGLAWILRNTCHEDFLLRDLVAQTEIIVLDDFPRLTACISAVNVPLVSLEVEHAEAFEAEFETALIQNYIQNGVISALLVVGECEHGLVGKPCTFSHDVHVIKRFLVFAQVSISLCTVENELTPTDERRR